MNFWLGIYLLGCLIVVFLVERNIINFDMGVCDEDDIKMNDRFMTNAIKLGVVILSWYIVVVMMIVAVKELFKKEE